MKYIGSMSPLQYSQIQSLYGSEEEYWKAMKNMYKANDMYGDINRVMRNPPEPLPDSARAIKEQCIALMDETWGPLENTTHVSGYNPAQIFPQSGYSYAAASASGYSSSIFGHGTIRNVISWNADPLSITDPYVITYANKP